MFKLAYFLREYQQSNDLQRQNLVQISTKHAELVLNSSIDSQKKHIFLFWMSKLQI